MALLNFKRRPPNELEMGGRQRITVDQSDPEVTCPNCRKSSSSSTVWKNYNVCPECGHHFRTNARQRILMMTDKDSFEELFTDIKTMDPLKFQGYQNKLDAAKAMSSEEEAVISGTASIGGVKTAIFVMEPGFMMGSMGSVVGEKVVRTFEYAIENRLPVVGFTVSGGARMQEGLYSLMQMAKTSGAVMKHSAAGLLYLTIITSPTTGGVTASFGMEGDIIFAEPGATIGFAGARVVEQTTRKPLPKGFQTAESMLEHGFIDAIVPRGRQKKIIARILRIHTGGKPKKPSEKKSVYETDENGLKNLKNLDKLEFGKDTSADIPGKTEIIEDAED